MREIIAYNDINDLRNHPRQKDIFGYPHISVSSDMTSNMKNKYGISTCKSVTIANIITIKELQDRIAGNWDNSTMEQIIAISSIIREMYDSIPDSDKSFYKVLKKNRIDLYNTLRLLIEADVYPNDLVPTCIEEKYLKKIWENFENEYTVKNFRQNLKKCLAGSKEIIQILSEFRLNISSKIILHGFYYATPIQQRIFDILESNGKDLIFLNCVDSNVSKIDEIWYKSYSTIDKSNWFIDKNANHLNTYLQNAFDKNRTVNIKNKIKLIEYESEMDFVKDVERFRDSRNKLFSADNKATEDLLKIFYPDCFKNRNLLSYPIAQYIYKLYSIWDDEDECIKISFDDLIDCFSSGMVVKNGINGINYITELEKLRTFIGDCSTIEEWTVRLNSLKEIKDNIIGNFDRASNKVSEPNPFRYLSCFDIDCYQLENILLLIDDILNIAKILFANNSQINIKDHLNKLRTFMKNRIDNSNTNDDSERIVFDKIYNKMLEASNIIPNCFPGEMCEAIKFHISGRELPSLENEINKNTLFRPSSMLDSSPLIDSDVIHLCYMSEKAFPGKASNYVWPLSDSMLKKLEAECSKKNRPYISAIRLISENNPITKRFLFNCLLQNKNIEISWISEINKKHINPSPYINLLKLLYGIKIEKYKSNDQQVENITAEECENNVPEIPEAELSSELRKLDKSLCIWRYIYSYKLYNHPYFSNEFHYSHAIPKLISLLTTRTELPIDNVKENVISLFPYMMKIEKIQLSDYVTTSAKYYVNDLNGKNIHYLNDKVIKAADRRVLGYFPDDKEEKEAQYYVCLFCPFGDICPYRDRSLKKPREKNDKQ